MDRDASHAHPRAHLTRQTSCKSIATGLRASPVRFASRRVSASGHALKTHRAPFAWRRACIGALSSLGIAASADFIFRNQFPKLNSIPFFRVTAAPVLAFLREQYDISKMSSKLE
jgi:hypothetical protein